MVLWAVGAFIVPPCPIICYAKGKAVELSSRVIANISEFIGMNNEFFRVM